MTRLQQLGRMALRGFVRATTFWMWSAQAILWQTPLWWLGNRVSDLRYWIYKLYPANEQEWWVGTNEQEQERPQ